MAITERALTLQEQKEIADHAGRAMSNLGITDPQAKPEVVCQAVEDFIDHWQAERRNTNPLKKLLARGPKPRRHCVGPGLFMGQSTCAAAGLGLDLPA